ncbi:MAG: hypothetical protein IJW51_03405 [Clostridia bacterium]|nr:hypothetical protein [Clostridia bacterium]
MRLAQNEHVIGEWEYAEAKAKKGFKSNKTTGSLVLTNKRIVHDLVDKRSITRKEVHLNQVVSIDYYHSKLPNFWAIVQIILGIPLCLVIVGIFMIKSAVAKLNAGDFIMEITTEGVKDTAMSIGSSKDNAVGAEAGAHLLSSLLGAVFGLVLLPFKLILGIFGIHFGRTTVKMHINHEVINEIIDSLGAAVLDSKQL